MACDVQEEQFVEINPIGGHVYEVLAASFFSASSYVQPFDAAQRS